MTEPSRHTASEMLAILSARQLKEGQVVFAGVGVPLLAATLAQRLRFGVGAFNLIPGDLFQQESVVGFVVVQ